MIHFDRQVCSDFPQAASKEWLETNGLGGFASSTIIGCNTRRYHGLLVAALNPPAGRTVLLSKLEEELAIDGITYPLSTNEYPGVIHPQGYLFQESFCLKPFPTFLYQAGGVRLEKEIFMPQGLNAVAISYRLMPFPLDSAINDLDFLGAGFAKPALLTGGVCEPRPQNILRLRPLVAGRHFHHLTRQGAMQIDTEVEAEELLVRFGWGAEVHLYHGGEVVSAPEWFYNLEYRQEMERGLDAHEDLFSPGVLTISLSEEAQWLTASAQPLEPMPEKWREQEITRRALLQKPWSDLGAGFCKARQAKSSAGFTLVLSVAEGKPRPQEIGLLALAADSFLVRRENFCGIIAGYHWFEEWGRDTLISLPGLCLTTGNLEAARGILLHFANACQQGMLPNRFTEEGGADYNSVDSALWFVNALAELNTHRGQETFIRQHLLPAAKQIVEHYSAGTHYGIHADRDGLIQIGEEGSQLTWMDAKVGGRVITPRAGKPVEIQALWYNALRILQLFGETRWREIADKAQQSFATLFWNAAENCLYDRIGPEGPDAAIRPNQVLTLSLRFPILTDDLGRQVLEVVEKELLTPYGLRTLSPRDSRYRGRYEGDVLSRDGAYHQGTVWPWLMGPFITAYLRLHGNTEEAKSRAREMLEPLFAHLSDAGLGTISEIFDGDHPHHPRGCISQAWSIAEILRAWTLLKDSSTAPSIR